MGLALETAEQRVLKSRRWMLECSPWLLENDDNARYDEKFWHFEK
jgi:hypothetical protein